MESFFIEVSDVNFGKKIIGGIYRPPENYISLFNIAFESLMSIVTRGKCECILAGDYNVYLLKSEQHIETEHFVNNLFLLIPLYRSSPCPLATTLIDIILTSNPQNNLVSDILISDISDHLPVFYISQNITKTNKPTFFTNSSRITSPENINKFKSALLNIERSDLCTITDADTAYEIFINKITKTYNDNIPIIPKKVRCFSKNHKPWITSAIINSIKKACII